MKLNLEWAQVPLKDGASANLIYTVDLNQVPQVAGIYVFGRRLGHDFEALYVGKAKVIRSGVKTQLNNLRLMRHCEDSRFRHQGGYGRHVNQLPP